MLDYCPEGSESRHQVRTRVTEAFYRLCNSLHSKYRLVTLGWVGKVGTLLVSCEVSLCQQSFTALPICSIIPYTVPAILSISIIFYTLDFNFQYSNCITTSSRLCLNLSVSWNIVFEYYYSVLCPQRVCECATRVLDDCSLKRTACCPHFLR